MAEPIVFQRPGYRLEITTDTYCLKVFRLGELVLASGGSGQREPGFPGSFLAGEKWARPATLKKAVRGPDSVDLVFGTTEPGIDVKLSVRLEEKSIRICWTPFGGGTFSLIGDVFRLDASGHWYGMGWVVPQHFPLENGSFEIENFWAHNVRSPFWLTSKGVGIFCQTLNTMKAALNASGDGLFRFGVRKAPEFAYEILIGADVREVYYEFVKRVGKPERIPPREVFARPIFSTWVEHDLAVTQEKVMEYAQGIVRHGLPCSVVEIDGNWETAYGDRVFCAKFPDPKKMVDELHRMGFQVTLWLHSFLDFDGLAYEEAKNKGYLVLDSRSGEPAVIDWWNGKTTLIDLTNPEAEAWFAGDIERLRRDYGFDGFKFDAGDAVYQPPEETRKTRRGITLNEYTDLFMEFAARHAYHLAEFRVHWLSQRLGVITRLGGKDTVWGLDNGLRAVITQSLTHGLLGYPYLIPDMIVGRVRTREKSKPLPTKEIMIRWMQASILMPIPQYSYAPWHYDQETIDLCRAYTRLHTELADYIYAVAREAHEKGTPMLRPLFFHYPEEEKAYLVDDEFLLGEDILVCPAVTEGAIARNVYLPGDVWIDAWDGAEYEGPRTIESYPAPLAKLPVFIRRQAANSAALAQIFRRRLPPLTGKGGGGK